MPFLSGSASFVRYKPDCGRPTAFTQDHVDRLADRGPGRQRIAAADGVETQWAAGDHVLDGDFTLLKQVYPDHLAFDFRIDTSALPAELMRAYYAIELKALTANNPSGFPSARQKRVARESARDRLEKEAADGRFIKRKATACLWDSPSHEVFFGGTSAAVQDRFASLFEQTFGCGLEPVTAGRLALRLNPRCGDESLSSFLTDRSNADGPAWSPDENGPPDFLGNEFLLWLWYVSDTGSDTLALPDGSEAVFMFSGGVKVEDPRGQTGCGTLNSDIAVRMPEARTAVRYGKLPRQAALTVVRHDDQFSFVLQAETLSVTSAKLPKPPDDLTADRARAEHRFQAVHDLAGTIDQMFAAFIAVRMGGGWGKELREIQSWLAASGRRTEAA